MVMTIFYHFLPFSLWLWTISVLSSLCKCCRGATVEEKGANSRERPRCNGAALPGAVSTCNQFKWAQQMWRCLRMGGFWGSLEIRKKNVVLSCRVWPIAEEEVVEGAVKTLCCKGRGLSAFCNGLEFWMASISADSSEKDFPHFIQ